MIFRTHIAFAFLIGLFFYFNFPLVNNFILFFLFLFLGAGFYDIDHNKIKFGINFFSRIITFFSKHRTIFHSLFFGVILTYLLFRFNRDSGIGFFLGFLSHIISDSFTKQGINFFYPFEKFTLSGFIKTGSFLETILFYFFVAACAILLWVKI